MENLHPVGLENLLHFNDATDSLEIRAWKLRSKFVNKHTRTRTHTDREKLDLYIYIYIDVKASVDVLSVKIIKLLAMNMEKTIREKKTTRYLGLKFFTRCIGLFLLFPLFAFYAILNYNRRKGQTIMPTVEEHILE